MNTENPENKIKIIKRKKIEKGTKRKE